jgi:hypothetical protein
MTRGHGGSAELLQSSNEFSHDVGTLHPFGVSQIDSWLLVCYGLRHVRAFPRSYIGQIRELLDSLYRVDSGRILATLIRLLGDFDLAEETMQESFAAAMRIK